MIVRLDKTFETNSLFLNSDWYNEGNYVIDETNEENQELIKKIKDNAPYMELVVENDKVIDVIPTERPEPEPLPPQPPTPEDRLEALELALLTLL